MTPRKLQRGLSLVIALSAFAAGCELIVDFDRTKIPVENTEGGAVTDGAVVDTGVTDAATEAATDADAETDAADASDAADAADADGG